MNKLNGSSSDEDSEEDKSATLIRMKMRARPHTARPRLTKNNDEKKEKKGADDKLLKLLKLSQFSPDNETKRRNSTYLNDDDNIISFNGSTVIAGEPSRGLRQFNTTRLGERASDKTKPRKLLFRSLFSLS